MGDYVLEEVYSLGVSGKTVTITGGTLDLSNTFVFNVTGDIILDDITVVANGVTIYANGNVFTVCETVTFEGYSSSVYGGSNGNAVKTTNLNLLSGTYINVYGGSNRGIVMGDTNVSVGGNVNADIDVADHSTPNSVYGGGLNDVVMGNTNVTFGGNAKAILIYGGGNESASVVMGKTNLNVNGGSAMGYYGGSSGGTVYETNVIMTAGSVEQIFGACYNTAMSGNANVTILGGNVTRRIYGGCYNDYDSGWKSDYHVNGNVNVTIGKNANIKFGDFNDTGIFAISRYNKMFADEVSTITFLDGCYSSFANKLGPQDLAGSFVIGIDKPYDNLVKLN